MSEYIKALTVLPIIIFTTFFLLKRFALPYVTSVNFAIWRNAILLTTAFLFLSQNLFLFLILTSIYIINLKKKIKSPAELFCVLLLVAPVHMLADLSIFEFSYVRVLSLVILLPYLMSILTSLKFGKHKADLFLVAYLLIFFICDIRGTTITDSLRHLIYISLDIFLPYLVLSRSIKTIQEMNLALFALFSSLLVCGNIGIFEHINQWLVYEILNNIFGTWGSSGYMGRGNDLRAVSSTGFPIVLGYVMTIALGLFVYLKETEVKHSKIYIMLVFAMVAGGCYAPVSRGPWVGAAFLILIFILINKNVITNLFKLKLIAACVAISLAGTPLGDKLFNLLPFVGETEKHNVEYRELLFEVSMTIIERYPFLGTYNFLDEPEMTKLYQGDVSNSDLKVDIVNSYIQIALANGLVGLGLFLGIFCSVLLSLLVAIRRAKRLSANYRLLGTALIAIILSIMVMITTVSSITIIPTINFVILGIAVAYTNIIKNELKATSYQKLSH